MSDKTLNDLTKLNISRVNTEPYTLEDSDIPKQEIRLLSEILRGTTINEKWRTPSIDVLTSLKDRKPTVVEDIIWATGSAVPKLLSDTAAAGAVQVGTDPISFGIGAGAGFKGAALGATLGKGALSWGGKIAGAVGGIAGGVSGALLGGALVSEGLSIKPTATEEYDNPNDPRFIAREIQALDIQHANKEISDEDFNRKRNAYINQLKPVFENSKEKNEIVELISGREYPDKDIVDSLISWGAKTLKDNADWREWQKEQRGMSPNAAADTVGSALAYIGTLWGASHLYGSALKMPRIKKGVEIRSPYTRREMVERLENFGKGYSFATMAGQYITQDILNYIEKTGDTELVNYKPSNIKSAMAGSYGAIGTITEYGLGGLDPIIIGSFKKVGIKLPLAKATGKITAQEAGEEGLQELEEFLAGKIDGTETRTWREALTDSLKAAGWGAVFGAPIGAFSFHTNRKNLIKGIKEFGKGQITDAQATQVADAMIESVENTINYNNQTLWENLRNKVAMYENADISNKEANIDAMTDLEYTLIMYDSTVSGIDMNNHPLFQGEVNPLGWFRTGVSEEIRPVVDSLLTELTDLQDQLKKLNEAKEKDWEKIDEIERKLEQFDRYVLDKLGENAPASLREFDNELRKVENKYVAKEKKKAGIKVPTDWFAKNIIKENIFTTEEGVFTEYKLKGDERNMATFTVFESPDGWIVRNAYVPESMQKQGIATNFYTEMNQRSIDSTGKPLRSTQPRTLKSGKTVFELSEAGKKLWDSLSKKGMARQLENKTYQFTEPTALFQDELFKIADENAHLDDIYPAYDGETIEVDGKERTVYNSTGERIAKSAEALRNFYKWFGDSKVVDAEGRPLVVYHGTNAEFSEFDARFIKSSTGRADLGFGYYFSSEKTGGLDASADWYGNIIMPVYLKSENPFIVPENEQELGKKLLSLDPNIETKFGEKISDMLKENKQILMRDISPSRILNLLLENKYDGIISGSEYVVHYSTQIKSVDNRGTYSEKTGNIYYQHIILSDKSKIYKVKTERPNADSWLKKQDLMMKTAKEFFGEATDWREAGYILPDGTLLDLSGANFGGGHYGYRQLDHRDIKEAFERFEGTKEFPNGVAMEDFINAGAIRFGSESMSFMIAQNPTSAQLKQIENLLQKNAELGTGRQAPNIELMSDANEWMDRKYSFYKRWEDETPDIKEIKRLLNAFYNGSGITPIMFQNRPSGAAPSTYRGAYIPQYRFIQRTNKMDASTLSHELAHDWFETNFARYRSGKATPDFMRAWGALEKALGITDKSTKAEKTKASEAFARAYEGWIMNNKNWEKFINVDDKDKDAIAKLMQDYQSDLRDIYQDLTNPYFKQTWGKLGEMKPEIKAWFDKVVNIQDLDTLVERGEMTEEQASQEKLNRAIDKVIETTTDEETAETLKEVRTLNDTARYEVEGGNKNSIQERLSMLAREIDENNMLSKGQNYDTRRDMMQVAEAADNFVKTRTEDALAIINGQMAEVEGLYKEDIYTALERMAVENADLNLLDELKNSEIANRLAKELGQRVAGFRNWKQSTDLDVVSALKSLDNRFDKALENKKAQKEFNSALEMLDKSIAEQDKVADKELESTLKELECK